MSNARIGMLLFLFSEAIFFVFLLIAFISFHSAPGYLSMTHELDLKTTGLYTGLLILSSFTAWRAHKSFLTGRLKQFQIWLCSTIVLGSAFLWGQLSEYARLFKKGITIGRDPLSTGFFTVTGFHGIHVAIGVFLLLMILFWSMVQKGRNQTIPKGSVETISLYWHFVDIVWIVVFAVVYIWGTR